MSEKFLNIIKCISTTLVFAISLAACSSEQVIKPSYEINKTPLFKLASGVIDSSNAINIGEKNRSFYINVDSLHKRIKATVFDTVDSNGYRLLAAKTNFLPGMTGYVILGESKEKEELLFNDIKEYSSISPKTLKEYSESLSLSSFTKYNEIIKKSGYKYAPNVSIPGYTPASIIFVNNKIRRLKPLLLNIVIFDEHKKIFSKLIKLKKERLEESLNIQKNVYKQCDWCVGLKFDVYGIFTIKNGKATHISASINESKDNKYVNSFGFNEKFVDDSVDVKIKNKEHSLRLWIYQVEDLKLFNKLKKLGND